MYLSPPLFALASLLLPLALALETESVRIGDTDVDIVLPGLPSPPTLLRPRSETEWIDGVEITLPGRRHLPLPYPPAVLKRDALSKRELGKRAPAPGRLFGESGLPDWRDALQNESIPSCGLTSAIQAISHLLPELLAANLYVEDTNNTSTTPDSGGPGSVLVGTTPWDVAPLTKLGVTVQKASINGSNMMASDIWWPAAFEKSIEAIAQPTTFILSSRAMTMISGLPASFNLTTNPDPLHPDQKPGPYATDMEATWAVLKRAGETPITVQTFKNGSAAAGLQRNHVFTVLKAEEVGGVRTLTLHNPLGYDNVLTYQQAWPQLYLYSYLTGLPTRKDFGLERRADDGYVPVPPPAQPADAHAVPMPVPISVSVSMPIPISVSQAPASTSVKPVSQPVSVKPVSQPTIPPKVVQPAPAVPFPAKPPMKGATGAKYTATVSTPPAAPSLAPSIGAAGVRDPESKPEAATPITPPPASPVMPSPPAVDRSRPKKDMEGDEGAKTVKQKEEEESPPKQPVPAGTPSAGTPITANAGVDTGSTPPTRPSLSAPVAAAGDTKPKPELVGPIPLRPSGAALPSSLPVIEAEREKGDKADDKSGDGKAVTRLLEPARGPKAKPAAMASTPTPPSSPRLPSHDPAVKAGPKMGSGGGTEPDQGKMDARPQPKPGGTTVGDGKHGEGSKPAGSKDVEGSGSGQREKEGEGDTEGKGVKGRAGVKEIAGSARGDEGRG